MSKQLNRKKEIHFLLSQVIRKYEEENNVTIVCNSNRKNYEPIAILLSKISEQLPETADVFDHDPYEPDLGPKGREYPFRKYDITGNQIKDAYFNQIVSNPRSFLVDSCYIYLYGKGKKGFLKNPVDQALLEILTDKSERDTDQFEKLRKRVRRNQRGTQWLYAAVTLLFFTSTLFLYLWLKQREKWDDITADMSLFPYQPSPSEINQMEGIWLCYTGSPQARPSDPERYHKVVPNIIDIKYKNGYFIYTRYGASFNHAGYMQFEAPGLVSIHTFVKNQEGKIESPRHSLLGLEEGDSIHNVISASWNFDVGKSNRIIGIREVYKKLGNKGTLTEIINSLENANCKCKIIEWKKTNESSQKFYLKNQLLESIGDQRLTELINERSILTQNPEDSLVIDVGKRKIP